MSDADDILANIILAKVLRADYQGPPELRGLGYYRVKPRAGSGWLGLQQMVLTCGLFVFFDKWGYQSRFCYERRDQAEAAFAAWDGLGDPPGLWVKQKGLGVDRLGPGAFHDEE